MPPGLRAPLAQGIVGAVRGDLQDPAPVQGAGVVRVRQAEGDELVALGIEVRAERVLVVVLVAPRVRQHVEPVGATVTVRVAHVGQLAGLGHDQTVPLPDQAEDLVQAGGERVVLGLGLVVVDASEEEHVPAARADGDATVGQDGERTGLDDLAGGRGDLDDAVVGAFAPGGAPARAEVLGGGRHGHGHSGLVHAAVRGGGGEREDSHGQGGEQHGLREGAHR